MSLYRCVAGVFGHRAPVMCSPRRSYPAHYVTGCLTGVWAVFLWIQNAKQSSQQELQELRQAQIQHNAASKQSNTAEADAASRVEARTMQARLDDTEAKLQAALQSAADLNKQLERATQESRQTAAKLAAAESASSAVSN